MKKNYFILKIFLTITMIVMTYKAIMPQVVITKNGDAMTKSERTEVIEILSSILDTSYVFPDKAKQMIDLVKSNAEKGAYDDVKGTIDFAARITNDLQSVSHDKHLKLAFSPENAARLINMPAGDNGDNPDEKELQEMKYNNYGFEKVERLSGNIGYIDIRGFAPSKYSSKTIESVMGFVSNCDAIIFDLRKNGGGDPTGIQMLSSYLFNEEQVHLNDLYFRPADRTDEFWTLREISGKRMPDVDVYILTSNYTFSGAEEFTYNLQNLKRAQIIGERTGGGAHPGSFIAVNDKFVAFVPNGRAINPITKTNWEGTGVAPDVEISQDKALDKARLIALKKLSERANGHELKSKLNWEAEGIEMRLSNGSIDKKSFSMYTGTYGERRITFENGDLYYQREGRPKMKMIPMSSDTFMFDEVEYFRVKFLKDSSGKGISIIGMYDLGATDKTDRTGN